MITIEERKKRVIAAVKSMYPHSCDVGSHKFGIYSIVQVDKKTLYKRSNHRKVLSEKGATRLLGVYEKAFNTISLRKGINFLEFIETLAHEIGHYLVVRNKVAFPNMQTEEAWATYFSRMIVTLYSWDVLRDAKMDHNNPKVVKSYRFKRYKTHWKLVKEFGKIIGMTKSYKKFRTMMRLELYDAILG